MALYLGKKRVCPSIQVEVPSMKAFFDVGGKCAYSTATSFEGIIKYGDTSNVTDMNSMFSGCSSLTTIPLLDTSNVTDMNSMFSGCSSLTEIYMYGMKASFDIHYSTKFTHEILVIILKNLATVTTTRKLTMGSTNLAKLTDEDKAIATNKGWTLA